MVNVIKNRTGPGDSSTDLKVATGLRGSCNNVSKTLQWYRGPGNMEVTTLCKVIHLCIQPNYKLP